MRLQTDPDGDLRHRREVRRQPAQARPRGRHAVQHVYARWPAADADRAAVAGVDRRGHPSAADRSTCTSSRAATARRSSRRTWPITIAPCQNTRKAGADRHRMRRSTPRSPVPSDHVTATAPIGRFITLEGIDGAGKSTHVAWLADAHRGARPQRRRPRASRAARRSASRCASSCCAAPMTHETRDAADVRGAARARRSK